MTPREQLPYLNTRKDSAVRFLGIPTVIRSTGETTNGAFGLIEHWMMPPGFASPYHAHHLEDEAFYVLEGEVAFVCDGKWLTAGPGTYVFGPREIPHGFKVVGSAPARMLLLCAPAGFEHFVLELSVPARTDSPRRRTWRSSWPWRRNTRLTFSGRCRNSLESPPKLSLSDSRNRMAHRRILMVWQTLSGRPSCHEEHGTSWKAGCHRTKPGTGLGWRNTAANLPRRTRSNQDRDRLTDWPFCVIRVPQKINNRSLNYFSVLPRALFVPENQWLYSSQGRSRVAQ